MDKNCSVDYRSTPPILVCMKTGNNHIQNGIILLSGNGILVGACFAISTQHTFCKLDRFLKNKPQRMNSSVNGLKSELLPVFLLYMKVQFIGFLPPTRDTATHSRFSRTPSPPQRFFWRQVFY